MASSKPLNGWSVVEVVGGWTVIDASGARLAFVGSGEQVGDFQGMSSLEAWQLASCIAALPQILLNNSEPKRRRIISNTLSDSKFTSLYQSLLAH
jgi:hypothetical protein